MIAAGTGWNGTVANAVLFPELGWKPSDHTQAEDRTNRIGQKAATFCYYMVAKGTIEEPMCTMLQEKQLILNAILDGVEDPNSNVGIDIMDKLEELLLKPKGLKQ
jgi:SNF2 family DNA or RNA helicase